MEVGLPFEVFPVCTQQLPHSIRVLSALLHSAIKRTIFNPAGVAHLVECCPLHWDHQFDSRLGHMRGLRAPFSRRFAGGRPDVSISIKAYLKRKAAFRDYKVFPKLFPHSPGFINRQRKRERGALTSSAYPDTTPTSYLSERLLSTELINRT